MKMLEKSVLGREMRRVAIRALFAISAFIFASLEVEGCCRTKFKPVKKYAHQ
jgi:hypothetical protein